MENLSNSIYDDKNGLNYTLHGDCYLPDLTLPEPDKSPIGHYGRMRLAFLREHRPSLYISLILSGKLFDHLTEIDETSQAMMDRMILQMAYAQGVDETLKARDPMAWVGQMNALKHQAEEIVLNELIYG